MILFWWYGRLLSCLLGNAGSSVEVAVLYGSQTGNATEIAKSISADANAKGIPAKAAALNDYTFARLPGTLIAVFVVSSTGDGDPPENCEAFYNALRRKKNSPGMLAGLHYTVLGLGDSNYTRYMAIPRTFTSRLPELGGRCFYPCREADEVDGLEDAVDSWTAGLWEPLKEAVSRANAPPGAELKTAPMSTSPASPPVQPAVSKGVATVDGELVGVPALQPKQYGIAWLAESNGHADVASADSKVSSRINGSVTADSPIASFTAANPAWVPVSAAKYMTPDWSDRVVIHLELDISQTGIQYRAGDSIGMLPQNNEKSVEALIKCLGFKGDETFSLHPLDDPGANSAAGAPPASGTSAKPCLPHIKQPCTLRQAFLHYVDITGVAKKGLLRVLAEYCSDDDDKTKLLYLSSRGGKDAYKSQIQEGRPGLLDLLQDFPSCRPDIAHLLDTLPPLVARYYSVTSSPAVHPDKIQVAFSVVKVKGKGGRVFRGVATNWVDSLLKMGSERVWKEPGQHGAHWVNGVQSLLGMGQKASTNDGEREKVGGLRLPIFPKSGGEFRLPANLAAPLIMIGPGTGVAPFRGFLEERGARLREEGMPNEGAVGASWLFFGCRRSDEDYLYREDFEGFVKEGILTRLVVAFSRAQEEKVYVQDKVRAHGGELYALLQNPKAHVFVCGDGAHMAKDVHAALLSLLAKHGDTSEAMAVTHLNTMIAEKRYIRDVWS
eukprot:TRINITY_DN1408_c0_g1_i4.p1 TRINITY_DN1408_c0_g1~~TRINITY_DN1408_c0_g1_i4.p1  ORF type:complete len:722 (-),score=109.53 TRINITY_DN1408_c0_g1_i4:140-2305(-)